MQFQACMREYGINLTESKIEAIKFTTDKDMHIGAFLQLISEAKKDFSTTKGIHISRWLCTT